MKLIFILPDADHASILRRRRYTKIGTFLLPLKSQKITEKFCKSCSHFQKEELSNVCFVFENLLLCRRADLATQWLKAGAHSQFVNVNKTQVCKKHKKKFCFFEEMKSSLCNGKYVWIHWFLKPSKICKRMYLGKRVSEKKGEFISKLSTFSSKRNRKSFLFCR